MRDVEGGKGYLATEASYRTGILTGTIPLPAITSAIPRLGKKKELAKKMSHIIYENYYGGFYWHLGEMAAEELLKPENKSERTIITAEIMELTNLYRKQREKQEDEDDKAEQKILSDIMRHVFARKS